MHVDFWAVADATLSQVRQKERGLQTPVPGVPSPAPQESQNYMHSICTTVGRAILPTASYDDMVQELSPGIGAPTTLDIELLLALYTVSILDGHRYALGKYTLSQ